MNYQYEVGHENASSECSHATDPKTDFLAVSLRDSEFIQAVNANLVNDKRVPKCISNVFDE